MRIVPSCIAAVGILASSAFAHPVTGMGSAFDAGLAHPFTGADHLIAVALVGTWSALAGGSARAVWPLTFLIAMLGGFAAAHGTEAASMLVPYVIGFAATIAVLLLVGMAAGHCGRNAARRSLLRSADVCAGLVGLLLLGGAA